VGFVERRADKLVFVLILVCRCARQDPAFRGVTGVVVKITHETQKGTSRQDSAFLKC